MNLRLQAFLVFLGLYIFFKEQQHSNFTYKKSAVHNFSSYISVDQYCQEIFIIFSFLWVIWPTLMSKKTPNYCIKAHNLSCRFSFLHDGSYVLGDIHVQHFLVIANSKCSFSFTVYKFMFLFSCSLFLYIAICLSDLLCFINERSCVSELLAQYYCS